MITHAMSVSRRLDLHNSATDFDTARHGRCGFVDLATGRICRLPQRHRGPCELRRQRRAQPAYRGVP
jgi:hypothetical protein